MPPVTCYATQSERTNRLALWGPEACNAAESFKAPVLKFFRSRPFLRPKPILYVALCDRDQWAVEAEWPDGTLERINTFNDLPRRLIG